MQVNLAHVQWNMRSISVVAETQASSVTFQKQACKCCHVPPVFRELSVDALQRCPELASVGSTTSRSTVHKQPESGQITHLCMMAVVVLKGPRSWMVGSWEGLTWAARSCLNRRLAEWALQCAWSITQHESCGLRAL